MTGASALRNLTRGVDSESPTIAAVVAPIERPMLDAAAVGSFSILHRSSVPDAVRAVREQAVDAVLLSAYHCSDERSDQVDELVRSFPGVTTVALVTRHDPRISETLLRLGATGVRQVVDVTVPAGWSRLRQLVAEPATRGAARILAPLLSALPGIPTRREVLPRGPGAARPGHPIGSHYCAEASAETQHADVPVCQGRASLPQDLSGGGSAAVRSTVFRGRRTIGIGCCLSAGLLVAAELRADPARHARDYSQRIPAPVPLPPCHPPLSRKPGDAVRAGVGRVSPVAGAPTSSRGSGACQSPRSLIVVITTTLVFAEDSIAFTPSC